jgi:hypothetical protein
MGMTQKIDLLAAFLGLRFLPMPFTIGSNTINPKLILHDETVEYRAVFTTTAVPYSEIEKVDVFILGQQTTNLCLYQRESMFTFIGNLNNRARLIEVLRFFQTKNCPLTIKALELIHTAEASTR